MSLLTIRSAYIDGPRGLPERVVRISLSKTYKQNTSAWLEVAVRSRARDTDPPTPPTTTDFVVDQCRTSWRWEHIGSRAVAVKNVAGFVSYWNRNCGPRNQMRRSSECWTEVARSFWVQLVREFQCEAVIMVHVRGGLYARSEHPTALPFSKVISLWCLHVASGPVIEE